MYSISSHYLQCSATCGTGWQRRQVLCHDEKGPSDSCADTQKPDTRQSCDAGACPRWVKGEWTPVSRNNVLSKSVCYRSMSKT